jgi:hypothetical protein
VIDKPMHYWRVRSLGSSTLEWTELDADEVVPAPEAFATGESGSFGDLFVDGGERAVFVVTADEAAHRTATAAFGPGSG